MNINFVVPCLLGLEAPIADELREMGASDVRAENGRVLFSGVPYAQTAKNSPPA